MTLSRRSFLAAALCTLAFAARAGDADILPDRAQEMVKRGEVLLVDVRTPAEWTETGIPTGAVTIDVTQGAEGFGAAVLKTVNGDRARPLAVICRSGHRSARAQAILQSQGFSRVINVKEGVSGGAEGPGWKARGLPMQGWAGQ